MRTQLFASFAIVAAALSASVSHAAVVTVGVNASFADAPYTYDFGGGNSVTFNLLNPGTFAPAGVSTAGTTQIASLGAPFYNPPQPTSYFSNRGGSIGPNTLAQFVGYASPATVPFSITDTIVGLRFDLGQGFQYGYAQIAGAAIEGFRFETTPGVGVNISAVPEPASWALMIGGFGLIGAAMRRRVVAGAAVAA